MAAARIATTAFLAQELSQNLGYPPRSRASAALAFAALVGYTSFSSIFLTGLATNFFVLGLLPPVDRARTSWLSWFGSAAPVGVFMFIGALAALLVLFRPEVTRGITAETLRRQQQILGPLSRPELVTLAALAVLLVGLVLPSSLHINTALLGIAALVILLAGGVLDRMAFRTSLEWGFLVLFGLLVGSGEVFRSVGLDRWIADRLVPLVHATGDPGLVVLLLSACVAACRLVLPRVPTNFLLSLALVPAASQLRVAPWLVGFVVLTVGNTWLLQGLSDFNILLRDATRGQLFTERQSVVAGAAITLVTLGAIAAAVPVWRAMGLLSR
jgi:di/tricarboxylate transporter